MVFPEFLEKFEEEKRTGGEPNVKQGSACCVCAINDGKLIS